MRAYRSTSDNPHCAEEYLDYNWYDFSILHAHQPLPQLKRRTAAAIRNNGKGKCDSSFVEINYTNDKQATDKERIYPCYKDTKTALHIPKYAHSTGAP